MAPTWTWAASGKHPAAGDYLRIGSENLVLPVFAGWVENGYERAAEAGRIPEQPWSWRFWSRGPKKDELVCGLIRSSSDRIGRVYPFLVLGKGSLKHWSRQWPLLAAVLEATWNRMEAVVVRSAGDLDRLTQELRRVPPPQSDWSRFQEVPAVGSEGAARLPAWNGPKRVEPGTGSGYRAPGGSVVVRIPRVAPSRQAAWIDMFHRDLARRVRKAPHVVFIGGSVHRCFIVVFTKLLNRDDFQLLLDLGTGMAEMGEENP